MLALGSTLLFGAAQAQVRSATLSGVFEQPTDTPPFGTVDPYSFATSFAFQTNVAPEHVVLAHTEIGGIEFSHDMYGYGAAALSGFSVGYGVKTWTASNLNSLPFGSLFADFWLDAPLANGTPARMWFELSDADGDFGTSALCGVTCFISNVGFVDDFRQGGALFADSSSLTLSLGPVPPPIPEPPTVLLVLTGLALLAVRRHQANARLALN